MIEPAGSPTGISIDSQASVDVGWWDASFCPSGPCASFTVCLVRWPQQGGASHWICSQQARAFPVRTRWLSLDNSVVPGSAPEVPWNTPASDGHELPKDRSPTAFPLPAPSMNLAGKVSDSLAEMQLSLPRHQAFLTETLSLP